MRACAVCTKADAAPPLRSALSAQRGRAAAGWSREEEAVYDVAPRVLPLGSLPQPKVFSLRCRAGKFGAIFLARPLPRDALLLLAAAAAFRARRAARRPGREDPTAAPGCAWDPTRWGWD